MNITLSIINIIFSPFALLLFLFSFSANKDHFFVSVGTNTSRLKAVPYLVYLSVFTIIVLATTFWVAPWLLINPANVFVPKYYWVSIPAWLVTAWTTYTYFRGMEGNIMGFIFFPMIAIVTMALLIVNLPDLYHATASIQLPAIPKQYFWPSYFLHAFMPLQLMLFLTEMKQDESKKSEWYVSLLGVLIFQLFQFVIHWILVYFFGQEMDFKSFFGMGQSMLYYVPALGGLIYFLLIMVANEQRPMESLNFIARPILVICVLLQSFNYFRLLGEWF